MELDLIGGYKTKISPTGTLDVGLTWYMYPGGANKTDYAEPFAKLSGTTGPVSLTAGVAYAPKQQAIGKWYNNGASAAAGVYDRPGAKSDNLYVWGDGAAAITGTPFTAKAHIGHSWGMDGLGPNATAPTPTGDYWDWSLGADTSWHNLTLGWPGSTPTFPTARPPICGRASARGRTAPAISRAAPSSPPSPPVSEEHRTWTI